MADRTRDRIDEMNANDVDAHIEMSMSLTFTAEAIDALLNVNRDEMTANMIRDAIMNAERAIIAMRKVLRFTKES